MGTVHGMSDAAWASGFVLATAAGAAVVLEALGIARARRRARRQRPDIEPVPWREMERYR